MLSAYRILGEKWQLGAILTILDPLRLEAVEVIRLL